MTNSWDQEDSNRHSWWSRSGRAVVVSEFCYCPCLADNEKKELISLFESSGSAGQKNFCLPWKFPDFFHPAPAWWCRCEWFSSLHQPIGTKTPLTAGCSQINFSWFSSHNLQIKRKKNSQISVICRKSRIPSEMSDGYNLFTNHLETIKVRTLIC